jgi:protein ImuB
MSLWLALRFPQLMLHALPNDDALSDNSDSATASPPAAVQAPVAIKEQHRIVAVNPYAAMQGIQAGMRVGTALTLCHALQIHPRHVAAEQRWLAKQAQRLSGFSPMICADQDCLLIEIGSSLLLFRGIDTLLDDVLSTLAQIECHAALGHTPLAAQVFTSMPLTTSRRAVMHATGHSAIHRLDYAATQARMLHLLATRPLNTLPLPETLQRSLQGPGLRHLRDLFALPRSALQRRFGRDFILWLNKLRGDQPDLRQPLIHPQRFRASVQFDEPVNNHQALMHPMQNLLGQMSQYLIRHQQQVRAIRWLFFPLRGAPESLLVRRAKADHLDSRWLDLSQRHLEHTRLRAPVLSLTLEAGKSLPLATPPAHLFACLERADGQELLEKLSNLPGLSLYRPGTIDTHLPELNESSLHPLDNQPGSPVSSPTAFVDSPLWLLDYPLPLRCQHNLPYWRGAAMELLPGKQHLSEEWWRASPSDCPAPERHYQVGRHPQGVYCWLFHTGTDQPQWFLQGFF